MIEVKPDLFLLFGRLDTWVVGIQYHGGAKELQTPDVVFELEPDNPFDPNAIAVYTPDGFQIGHLPRYDACYFTALIAEGIIALKGRVGDPERGDRLPLALEVYATSKVSGILVSDPRDDWRALYHNLFIALWDRLGDYSASTLEEFRGRFRPFTREQALYPKTQFLYRMLKAYIADLRKKEADRLRGQVLASVEAMNFGQLTGWPELAVVPLDVNGAVLFQGMTDPGVIVGAAAARDVMRLLPSRCPYSAGAHGAVVLVHGRCFSLDWFESPELAQVYWYQMMLTGLEQAKAEEVGAAGASISSSEGAKEAILGILRKAVCSIGATEEEGGGKRIDIQAVEHGGEALYGGSVLHHLRLRKREAAIETIEPSRSRFIGLPSESRFVRAT